MEYLIILLVSLASALLIEWRYQIRLYSSRKKRLIITGVFFVVGVVWDHWAIWRGHWAFPGNGMVGLKIGLMPLEEYLFILVLPFWILTVYQFLDRKIK